MGDSLREAIEAELALATELSDDKYEEKWVAIESHQVVASANTAEALEEQHTDSWERTFKNTRQPHHTWHRIR